MFDVPEQKDLRSRGYGTIDHKDSDSTTSGISGIVENPIEPIS